MRLVLQADLKHLTELLKDISGSSPLLDVERLEVRNAQGETGKLQVNMTVASFVVIDKNSPITRRRAVTAAKPAAVEPGKSGDPSAQPAASESVKPTAQPPTAGPSVGGPGVRSGDTEHRVGSANGNRNGPPAVPPGVDPRKSTTPRPVPQGGAK